MWRECADLEHVTLRFSGDSVGSDSSYSASKSISTIFTVVLGTINDLVLVAPLIKKLNQIFNL